MVGSENGFAVVDVETTGVGKQDRVIEIAVVLLDRHLRVTDEYETLIDPQRDLGPTHVHGITPAMISMAPTFEEIASAVAERINGRVLVAHNLAFEVRMLRLEFDRQQVIFDPGLGVCTLKLTKQKLPEACRMLQVAPPLHHRALADARATAAILGAVSPHLEMSPVELSNVAGQASIRTHRRCADPATPVLDRLLSRVVYSEGDERLVQYMDLLDWVLDDLVVTVEELQQLDELTADLKLTELEILSAHEQYFQAMVNGANKDGIITKEEHHTLLFIARALEIPIERVPAISSPNVGDEAIKAGAAICFTGTFVDSNGDKIPKSQLETMATNHGFRVVSNVTKSKCDVVVAVDPSSSSGKAKKAREYGKPVIAAQHFLKQAQRFC